MLERLGDVDLPKGQQNGSFSGPFNLSSINLIIKCAFSFLVPSGKVNIAGSPIAARVFFTPPRRVNFLTRALSASQKRSSFIFSLTFSSFFASFSLAPSQNQCRVLSGNECPVAPLNPHLIGASRWVSPKDRVCLSLSREMRTLSRMSICEVDLILSSRRARVKGSVSEVKRCLSSARSLWAVE